MFNLEVHSHIEGSSKLINFFNPVVKDLQLISATILIGLLLSIVFFIKEEHGKLTKEALRVRTLARFSAAVWSMTTLGYLFLTLTSILNVPITDSFDKTIIRFRSSRNDG